MANTTKCGDCKKYSPSERPIRKKGGGMKKLRTGHCLAKTVYASNRVDNPVFPPGAKTATLEGGQHKIHLVREESIEAHCTDVEPK
jgi:hypothetical protein